jgi:hypothetical protein
MFGMSWLSLPIVSPHGETGDYPAVGEHAWTSFMATENFHGPLSFWLPRVWADVGKHHRPARGNTLDVKVGPLCWFIMLLLLLLLLMRRRKRRRRERRRRRRRRRRVVVVVVVVATT